MANYSYKLRDRGHLSFSVMRFTRDRQPQSQPQQLQQEQEQQQRPANNTDLNTGTDVRRVLLDSMTQSDATISSVKKALLQWIPDIELPLNELMILIERSEI